MKSHQKSLRSGRIDESGFYYFLTTITKNRSPLFLNNNTGRIVLDSLQWLDDNDRMSLIAAVVMPDHVHIIAELKKDSLAGLMHSFKSYTANEINKSLGEKGNVWERQYYESVIRDEASLLRVVKYCLENPVRKGLVEDFRDYKYWYCTYEI